MKSKGWILPSLILLTAFILSSWPLFQPGMFKIHDFTHGARVAEMSRALTDGHFPVRWSQNFGFGYGMPLFEFYGPLPFYLGGLIHLITNNLILAVKSIFFVVNALSLIGAYLCGKKLFNNKLAALVTALAFSLAPYRFLNLYVRGALNELWGIMALPWIVWGVLKIIKQEKLGWLWFTLGLAVLFLSHNISTLIFLPIIFFLIILLIVRFYPSIQKNNNLTQVLLQFFLSGMLAFGLSAFYLLPAYFEKDLTQVEDFILGDYFDFRIHFVYLKQFFKPHWGYGGSEYGPNDPISFFLGYGQIFALLGAVVVILTQIYQSLFKKSERFVKNIILPLGLFSLTAAALFMSTHYSLFIWEKLPLIEFAQFPWRFLGISLFLIALIAGWVVKAGQKLLLNKPYLYRTLALALMILALLNLQFARPEYFLNDPQRYYYAEPNRIRSEMSHTLPDYLPVDLNSKLPWARELIHKEANYADGIRVVTNKTHFKQIQTNFDQPTQLTLNLAYYPGWEVRQEGAWVQANKNEDGLLTFEANSGRQMVEIKFKSTSLRQISDLVSLISLAIMAVLTARVLLKQKNILFNN